MATLSLSKKIKLDIKDNGKIIKTFNVTYKELTRKQQRKLGKDNKEALELSSKGIAIEKRIKINEEKLNALRELGESEKVVKLSDKIIKFYDDREDLLDKAGEDWEDALDSASKLSFDLSVGGDDKEALGTFIEEYSDYTTVLNAIIEDAEKQKGN